MNELFSSVVEIIYSALALGIVIAIFAGFFKLMDWLASDKKNSTPQEEKEIDTESGTATSSEEYPYIKPYLLTKNEWSFYKALKPITDKYRLHILAKVRLADLVSVKSGLSKSEYNKAFAKIKAKHVDFVLANPSNLAIKCAIELDDSSHNDIDRQQRDYFLDKVCETVKLPLIHCKDANGIEDKICETLKINKKTS